MQFNGHTVHIQSSIAEVRCPAHVLLQCTLWDRQMMNYHTNMTICKTDSFIKKKYVKWLGFIYCWSLSVDPSHFLPLNNLDQFSVHKEKVLLDQQASPLLTSFYKPTFCLQAGWWMLILCWKWHCNSPCWSNT